MIGKQYKDTSPITGNQSNPINFEQRRLLVVRSADVVYEKFFVTSCCIFYVYKAKYKNYTLLKTSATMDFTIICMQCFHFHSPSELRCLVRDKRGYTYTRVQKYIVVG